MAEDRRRADAEQERERGRTERPISEHIDDEAPYEGPDKSRLQTDRHGDDDADDEHQMRLRCSDPEVRADGQFQQGRHRRTDRGEQQGHRAGRSSAIGQGRARPHGPSGVGRTAATLPRSIPRTAAPRQRTESVRSSCAPYPLEPSELFHVKHTQGKPGRGRADRRRGRAMPGAAVSRETLGRDWTAAGLPPGVRARRSARAASRFT